MRGEKIEVEGKGQKGGSPRPRRKPIRPARWREGIKKKAQGEPRAWNGESRNGR